MDYELYDDLPREEQALAWAMLWAKYGRYYGNKPTYAREEQKDEDETVH